MSFALLQLQAPGSATLADPPRYERTPHACVYAWVPCQHCQPTTSKPYLGDIKMPAGMDQYGNRCQDCDGRGVVPACAQCSVDKDRYQRRYREWEYRRDRKP